MAHRDYRKEVGIASAKKDVPRPVAIIVLVLVGVVIAFSAIRISAASHKHHAAKSGGAAAATTGQ